MHKLIAYGSQKNITAIALFGFPEKSPQSNYGMSMVWPSDLSAVRNQAYNRTHRLAQGVRRLATIVPLLGFRPITNKTH